MLYLFFRHLPFSRQSLRRGSKAVTLVELLLVVAIAGTLAAIGIPVYTNYMDKVNNNKVLVDIREVESKIVAFQVEFGAPPNNLAQVGVNLNDPWGRPYRYLRIQGLDPLPAGHQHDKHDKPLNPDFDLYSIGKDGITDPKIWKANAYDDIIRCNNGAYVGPVSEY